MAGAVRRVPAAGAAGGLSGDGCIWQTLLWWALLCSPSPSLSLSLSTTQALRPPPYGLISPPQDLGYLVTKKKLEEEDSFEEFVNRNSKVSCALLLHR